MECGITSGKMNLLCHAIGAAGFIHPLLHYTASHSTGEKSQKPTCKFPGSTRLICRLHKIRKDKLQVFVESQAFVCDTKNTECDTCAALSPCQQYTLFNRSASTQTQDM